MGRTVSHIICSLKIPGTVLRYSHCIYRFLYLLDSLSNSQYKMCYFFRIYFITLYISHKIRYNYFEFYNPCFLRCKKDYFGVEKRTRDPRAQNDRLPPGKITVFIRSLYQPIKRVKYHKWVERLKIEIDNVLPGELSSFLQFTRLNIVIKLLIKSRSTRLLFNVLCPLFWLIWILAHSHQLVNGQIFG